MSVGFHLKVYLASIVGFFLIDMVWLGVVARGFYRKHLGYLLSPSPNWGAATLFYLLFVLGVVVFAVIPALRSGSLRSAVVHGGLLGLIAYSTYDLTNLATIKGWPLTVTVVDLIWGTFLSTSVAAIGYLAGMAMR